MTKTKTTLSTQTKLLVGITIALSLFSLYAFVGLILDSSKMGKTLIVEQDISTKIFKQKNTSAFLVKSKTPLEKQIVSHTARAGDKKSFNLGSIKAVSISGQVILDSEKSYARVILKELNKPDKLVFEAAYPDRGIFSFQNSCEETCALETTKNASLSFEIHRAQLSLNEISYLPQTGKLTDDILVKGIKNYQKDLKTKQVQTTIDEINRVNKIVGQPWIAGMTDPAMWSYDQKKKLISNIREDIHGPLSALQGMEYYVEGYLDLREDRTERVIQFDNIGTDYGNEFDWRNRHDQDWMTPVKNQHILDENNYIDVNCGSCWAFGAVGAVEANINLYFNQKLDIDLAEQDLVSCSNTRGCHGGYTNDAMQYIEDIGVVDEACFPYIATDDSCLSYQGEPLKECFSRCPEDKCINSEYRLWKISGHREINQPSKIEMIDSVVNYGPVAFTYASWWHTMTLSGFGI
ncbi:hypothetical protein K8R42_04180, partial [bacterium]|nr:hypothetical protein [bacterium]